MMNSPMTGKRNRIFSLEQAPGWRSLWLLIALLMAAYAGYLFTLASDIYVSEAKLVVYQEQPAESRGASSMPAADGRAQEDAALLQTFIASREMLRRLEQQLQLKAHYQSEDRDFWSRLAETASFEEFSSFYQSMIEVSLDEPSAVLTVAAKAYSPQMAQAVAQKIVANSEAYFAEVSAEIARQRVKFYDGQIAQATEKMRAAKATLLEFQDSNHLLDPAAEGKIASDVVTALETESAKQQAELNRLRTYLADEAPEVVAARQRFQSMEKQIRMARSKQGDSSGTTMNSLLAEFQMAQMAVQFATSEYQAAVEGREQARQEALRKSKHVVVVSPADLPEEALYPRRWYRLATLLVLLLVASSIARLVWIAILDH